ncbi:MAG: hypothetical protein Ct9H300mP28_31550 [Pseudomonadota bacterium]|nr:MAG: hypothetical protein Ct9H300mP28_31550 [Pseudomonadota bacterium]
MNLEPKTPHVEMKTIGEKQLILSHEITAITDPQARVNALIAGDMHLSPMLMPK